MSAPLIGLDPNTQPSTRRTFLFLGLCADAGQMPGPRLLQRSAVIIGVVLNCQLHEEEAMRRPVAIAAACAAVLGLVVGACTDGNDGEAVAAEELQQIVTAWAERNDVRVVAVSVISPPGSVTSVGYSAESEAPGESALFLIGSLAKTMTAATTLLLVEDGVLDLDEPIQRWHPEFPRADEITLRKLLSHTAGLAEESSPRDFTPAAFAELQETKTTTELLAEAASSVGEQSLPTTHRYTSLGYWVAGTVIEAATGEELAGVIRARLFEPLGMADSYLDWPESVDDELVLGEMTVPGGLVVPLERASVRGVASRAWGAGGVLSSTRDVATFYGAVLDDLMAETSVEAMTSTTPGSDYGLGIATRRWPGEITGWGHSGANAGYSSSAGVTDDDWAVAVLTNHVDLADIAGSGRNAKDLIGELLAHISAEN